MARVFPPEWYAAQAARRKNKGVASAASKASSPGAKKPGVSKEGMAARNEAAKSLVSLRAKGYKLKGTVAGAFGQNKGGSKRYFLTKPSKKGSSQHATMDVTFKKTKGPSAYSSNKTLGTSTVVHPKSSRNSFRGYARGWSGD